MNAVRVFDPEPWDGKDLQWQDKRFVKDRVISFLSHSVGLRQCNERTSVQSRQRARPLKPCSSCQTRTQWRRDAYRGHEGCAGRKHGQHLRDVPLQGFLRRTVPEHSEMDRGDEDLRAEQGQEPSKTVFLLYDMPEMREKYGKNYVAILAQSIACPKKPCWPVEVSSCLVPDGKRASASQTNSVPVFCYTPPCLNRSVRPLVQVSRPASLRLPTAGLGAVAVRARIRRRHGQYTRQSC